MSYEDRPLRRALSLSVLPTYSTSTLILPSSRYIDLPYSSGTVARLRRAASIPDLSTLSTRLSQSVPPIRARLGYSSYRTWRDWSVWDDYDYDKSYYYKPYYQYFWPYSYLSKYRYHDYPLSRWWYTPPSYYADNYYGLTYPYRYSYSSLYSPYYAPSWRRYYDPYYGIDRQSWLGCYGAHRLNSLYDSGRNYRWRTYWY